MNRIVNLKEVLTMGSNQSSETEPVTITSMGSEESDSYRLRTIHPTEYTSDKRTMEESIGYSRTISIINNLAFDVVVVNRDGTWYVIEGNALENKMRTPPRTLLVYKYTCHGGLNSAGKFNNTYRRSSPGNSKVNTKERENQIEEFDRSIYTNSSGVNKTEIIYNLDHNVINFDKNSYIANLDIVLTRFIDEESVPMHPYSDDAVINSNKEDTRFISNKNAFGYHVKAVVNDPALASTKFINIAGKVYKVPVRYSSDIPAGVTVSFNNEVKGNGGNIIKNTNFYSWEDEGIKGLLFNTHAEAKELGDLTTKRKNELIDKEFEIKQLNLDIAKITAEMNKLKAENSLLKEKRDLQNAAARLEYENKLVEKQRELEILRVELSKEKANRENQFGTDKLNREKELSELKAEKERERIELERKLADEQALREKEKMEREEQAAKDALEREYEKRRMEAERELLKHERDRAKARADINHMNRKNLAEFIKWAPVLITTLTGAFNLAGHLMSRKDRI